MSESINYNEIKSGSKPSVYVVQEIAGTKEGTTKNKYNRCGPIWTV
jgi:hypothetical protein